MSAVGNTIIAKGKHNNYEEGIVVTATITPGMLVEIDSTEDADFQRPKVKRQANANGTAVVAFAIEDGLVGKTIDDAYAVGDPCRYVQPQPGDEAWIFLAGEQNITRGDTLTFGSAGALIVYGGSGKQPVCEALETKDLTGLAAARIKVRFV